MRLEEVLEGLDEAQRHAVTHPARCLAIEAGAGSGKTRVLSRRIAYRVLSDELDPRNVLAITFTRHAAAELAGRLRALGLRDAVAAGTFHAVAYAQLRSRWAGRNIDPPTLLDRKVPLIARLLASNSKASPAEVSAEIEWAKARTISPNQYAAAANAEGRRTPGEPGLIAELFHRYETEKRRRRLVDFDDLLRLCAHDMTTDKEFAAAQHWRFRHLFVDEFQDVNPLQFGLLRAWLGDRDDLCVVGDPHQAIYGWNGADAHYLTDLCDHLPDAETVLLDCNYRSTPQILAVAAAALDGRQSVRIRPVRPDGEMPVVREHPDDLAEARAVAAAVRENHMPGGHWSNQAVLVRTNAQAALIEDALSRAGVPFRVRGGRALADTPEVKLALKRLETAPFEVAVADLEAEAHGEGGSSPEPAGDREAAMQALVRVAHDYAAIDPHPTTAGLVAWLRDSSGVDTTDPASDAVEVSTFHAAKGLEWPVVHIAGLEEGLVPIGHARAPDALAEEQRLLYVAITRAERTLHCSWARQRTFGTTTVTRSPSRYLRLVSEAVEELKAGRPQPDSVASVRSQRSRLRRTGPDEDLSPSEERVLATLQAWRANTARAAGVAPFVVFHDRTLLEVVRRRPRSTAELLTIPGIGQVKAARYGEALLHLLGGHLAS